MKRSFVVHFARALSWPACGGSSFVSGILPGWPCWVPGLVFGRGGLQGSSLCAFGLATGIARVSLAGQDEQAVKTLHVYTDTIQIPVLVLSAQHEALPSIAPTRFNVVIDGGPKFRVSHVRLEGDDPISLSILLDVSGDEAALMSKVSGEIAGLAPLSLRPADGLLADPYNRSFGPVADAGVGETSCSDNSALILRKVVFRSTDGRCGGCEPNHVVDERLESEDCLVLKREINDWIGFWGAREEKGADVSGAIVYAAAVLGGPWVRAAATLRC